MFALNHFVTAAHYRYTKLGIIRIRLLKLDFFV
jgi:hypothetical protein